MEIKQYKDCAGDKVKIGDIVRKYNWGERGENLGKVISLRKEGFYVWVKTEKSPKYEVWGKFTEKVK